MRRLLQRPRCKRRGRRPLMLILVLASFISFLYIFVALQKQEARSISRRRTHCAYAGGGTRDAPTRTASFLAARTIPNAHRRPTRHAPAVNPSSAPPPTGRPCTAGPNYLQGFTSSARPFQSPKMRRDDSKRRRRNNGVIIPVIAIRIIGCTNPNSVRSPAAVVRCISLLFQTQKEPLPPNPAPTMSKFMYSGCICCQTTCNFEEIMLLCKGDGTCICTEGKCCLAANAAQFPIGLIKEDGFILKLGLPCCTCGLKVPDMKNLISVEEHCLCLQAQAQFPFGDKIPKPVCAVCFVQCLPGIAVLKPPPSGGAPPAAEEMER